MDRKSLVREVRRLSQDGRNIEEAIELLRRRGCWKIESIKVLQEAFGMSLPEAKERVHFSPAWADTIDADESLHEALEESLQTDERTGSRIDEPGSRGQFPS